MVQKDAEHYSNLYDDAYMPHMQRLTWSGIALHGGPLPGRPASHGCVRMPYDFAEQLFSVTSLGMRVIVAPREVVPVKVFHPALFPPKSGADTAAAARATEADEAASKADQALAAVTASREAARHDAGARGRKSEAQSRNAIRRRRRTTARSCSTNTASSTDPPTVITLTTQRTILDPLCR